MENSTIYDIAREVGVSSGTVSRALNGHSRVSGKTREAVQKVAERLDYRPSIVAKSLREGRTRAVGLVLPDFRNPFYTEFLAAAERACGLAGYRLAAVEYALDPLKQSACLEQMIEQRCEGVIAFFSFSTDSSSHLLRTMRRRKIPCLVPFVPPDSPITSMDGVWVDLSKGISLAVSHLTEIGHREIALMLDLPSGVSETEFCDAVLKNEDFGGLVRPSSQLAGFIRAMRDNAIEPTTRNLLLSLAGDGLEGGRAALSRMLHEKRGITAVICQNDLMAVGALQAAFSAGCRVPRDLSLIGHDNTQLSEYAAVPLTSIETKTEAVARSCVKIALDRIAMARAGALWGDPLHEWSEPELVIRKSTAPV